MKAPIFHGARDARIDNPADPILLESEGIIMDVTARTFADRTCISIAPKSRPRRSAASWATSLWAWWRLSASV